MLSAHADPSVAGDLELNVFADGLFDTATYVFTILGIGLLWRGWRRPDVPIAGRALLGSVILGWGIFNLVEGLLMTPSPRTHSERPAAYAARDTVVRDFYCS